MKPTCSTTVQGPMYKSINFHNHVCSVRHHWHLEGDVAEYAEVSLLTHLWESSRSPDHIRKQCILSSEDLLPVVKRDHT